VIGLQSLLDLIRTLGQSHLLHSTVPPSSSILLPLPTPSPPPLGLFYIPFVSFLCQSSSTQWAAKPPQHLRGMPHFLTPTTSPSRTLDINDHLAFQLTPLFMDAESLYASQYSANWTTSPVLDPPVRNPSSSSSTPNLPPPRYNSSSSSVMLNTPISRTSPAMSHPMSNSVDSHNPLQSFTSSELSNVFSTPLDPDTFAALAASGMLPPPLSQPLHPSSETIRNPYVVQPSPFLTTSPSHIVNGQYPSKLSSYSHTIPNSGPQIRAKQTIVRRIACFLSPLPYFPLRRSSNLTGRSLTCTFRTTSMLALLRSRIDPSTVGLLAPPPLTLLTASSHLLMVPVTTLSAPNPECLLPYGCLPLQPPHPPPGFLTQSRTIL